MKFRNSLLVVLSTVGFLALARWCAPIFGPLLVLFAVFPVVTGGWFGGPKLGGGLGIGLLFAHVWVLPFFDRQQVGPSPEVVIDYFLVALLGIAAGKMFALRYQLRCLQQLSDASPDCVLVARAHDGSLVAANRIVCSALGYEREFLLRNVRLDAIASGLPHVIDGPSLDQAAKTEQLSRSEFRRKDGTTFWVEVNLSVLHAGGEELLFLTARDVSCQLGLEEKLVQEAAEALRAKHLIIKEAQSHHLNRLAQMGTMAAGMAHEINNPLAFIVANHEFLQSMVLPEMQRKVAADDVEMKKILGEFEEALADASLGSARIKSITQELKLFARMPQVGESLVELASVARTAARMAKHNFDPGVEFELVLDENVQTLADESKLSQVLINLLTNAAHAVEGRPHSKVTLRTRVVDGRGSIEVHDTGCGIAPENLEHIFEPFFTTKAIGQGTGLGLSISKSMVEEMGGALSVKSKLHEGTSIYLSLAAPKSRPTQNSDPIALKPSSERFSVLIVDDEAVLLRSLERGLAEDYDVTTVNDGTQALKQLAHQRFDVVLCDLMMPNMTGMALFRSMLTRDPHQASHFLFMSGGSVTVEASIFSKIYRDRVLAKPLSPEILQKAIARQARMKAKKGDECNTCSNIECCPVFPLFDSIDLLKVYKQYYCEAVDGSHQMCERFRHFRTGQRPPDELLPDGERLPSS